MATDFFQRQDQARRQSTLLVALFIGSVVVIVLSIYAVLAVMYVEGLDSQEVRAQGWIAYVRPDLLLGVTLLVGSVIAVGSLYKIHQLGAGGEVVALMLGGRRIPAQTQDLAERRLLNVVEEMALASGVAVPPVFVLDNEPGINAFAAGHQPDDAVVAVSRGSLNYLTRDELQGVVAHEFSHILNGDMRLNLRLVGVVHGLLVLALVGYYLLRMAGHTRSRKNNPAGAIIAVGIVLMAMGYLGVFLGRIIRYAVSRQREYLADAAAVQFTRNPPGIAGALKKIGGLAEGSRIRNEHAAEVSHMFFGDAFAGAFLNLLATHPPLGDRILRIDPQFDGRFPAVRPVTPAAEEAVEAFAPPRSPGAGRAAAPSPAIPMAAAQPAMRDARSVIAQVGTLGPRQIGQANSILAGTRSAVLDAAREPFAGRALVYALLLSADPRIRDQQLAILAAADGGPAGALRSVSSDVRRAEDASYQQVLQLEPELRLLDRRARLPLVEIAAGALRSLSVEQYRQFRSKVEALVAADARMDVFEFSLQAILLRGLDVHFALRRPDAVRYHRLQPLAHPLAIVLSLLAHAGNSQPDQAGRAFQAAMAELSLAATVVPRDNCSLRALAAALDRLAEAAPLLRRRILQACTTCVAADGRLTAHESELLRAVAAILRCPVPPLVADDVR